MSWLNGVPSSGPRRSRRQEEEKPASGWRGSLLPPPAREKSPERSAQESNILLFPFLWGRSHLLLEGSGANESEFLGLTEAFFCRRADKAEKLGGGSRDSRKLSRTSEEKRSSGNIRVDMKIIWGQGGSFFK